MNNIESAEIDATASMSFSFPLFSISLLFSLAFLSPVSVFSFFLFYFSFPSEAERFKRGWSRVGDVLWRLGMRGLTLVGPLVLDLDMGFSYTGFLKSPRYQWVVGLRYRPKYVSNSGTISFDIMFVQ